MDQKSSKDINKPTSGKGAGRGGPRPGSGRKKGQVSQMSYEARMLAKQTGDLPHEILLKMARGIPIEVTIIAADGTQTKRLQCFDLEGRRTAALGAAPYYAPRLNAIEFSAGVTEDELDEFIERASAQAGLGLGVEGEAEED